MTPQERLLAEAACIKLQHRYCITADRCDVEGFTALFTGDGSIKVPEYPAFVGHDAIRAAMQALVDAGVTNRHVTTNSIIDVHDPTRASGICYLTVYASTAAPDAAGCRPIALPGTVGEYEDEFVAGEQGWRFKSRLLTRIFRGPTQTAITND